jgi:GxxExxY protein
MKDINEVSGLIVDAAYRIHTKLGPGLLESVYETILAKELETYCKQTLNIHSLRLCVSA